MRYFVLFGRIFYSMIFIMSSLKHFSKDMIDYAASHGVVMPSLLVPAAGILALLGGLSVLLGFRARIGALMLILFLVPVTLTMHNFWAVADPSQAQIQQIMFMKNLSMLGAAFLIAHFGSGPISLDGGNRSDHVRGYNP